MKNWILSFLLTLTVTGILAANEQEKAEFVRPLQRGSGPIDQKQSFVRFDSELYRKINHLSADLRIYTPDGQVVPFRVRLDQEVRKKTQYTARETKLLDFIPAENHGNFIVENPTRAQIARLSIDTPDRDFVKTVRIEAGNDRKNWIPVGKVQPFYDYTTEFQLARKQFDFPETDARYFRITIGGYRQDAPLPLSRVSTDGNGNVIKKERDWLERKLKIDRFQLFSKKLVPSEQIPRETAYPLLLSEHRQIGSQTLLRFESGREPLIRLKFSAQDPFFSRRVTVYGENDGASPVQLVEGTIRKLHFLNTTEDAAELTLPQSRFRRYRIEIDNGDNAPLVRPQVAGIGVSHCAYFITQEPQLQLYYGGKLSEPRYDLDIVLNQLNLDRCIPYTLGTPERNSVYSLIRSKWFSYLPAAAVVILLAGVSLALWRGLKKVDSQEDENPQKP